MRRLGVWVGWAALLVALGAAAVAAAPPKDDDDEDGGPKASARPPDGWNPAITWFFGLGAKKPAPKPDKEKDKEPEKKRDAPAPRPSPQAEAAANLRRLEEAKLHRRQDVCLRLREIARETNDDALERKALELDHLAWEVYLERTQLLGGGASDAERLTAPSPRSGGPGAGGTASVREVKP
jgi:hypothetical protein